MAADSSERFDYNQQAAAPPVAAPLPVLERLGDFRILREIGRGGMGVVYKAEQVSLGRHVALKVLPQKLLIDPQAKQCFEREAKAAARLHHTNIVPVFGVGEQAYAVCYVVADRERTGPKLKVGSDDQSKVYLNGKEISATLTRVAAFAMMTPCPTSPCTPEPMSWCSRSSIRSISGRPVSASWTRTAIRSRTFGFA